MIIEDGDLLVHRHAGHAYARDLRPMVAYDATYLRKVQAYEGTVIASAVNNGRCAMLMRHLQPPARVLDVGAGTGAFVIEARKWGYDALGYEVIPDSASALREAGLYAPRDPVGFDAVTAWDVLEHMENPAELLRSVPVGAYVFASIPVFEDLARIRESKHYRPGEHLHYFSESGFILYFERVGFKVVEVSDHETRAGRESIGAFAFLKDRP